MIAPGTQKAAARVEAARLLDAFAAAGALLVEADILQSADTLLDLYGEEIRARAFTTWDPLRGEMMLRPDFTVPVVQAHMADGAEPARYTYAGEVFRRQEVDPERAAEYLQVGFEIFDGSDPAASDAEVFALFAELLAPLGLRAATGDIGLLAAVVGGLRTTKRRRAALLRHIWRPRRFRALLDRFAGRAPPVSGRAALLAVADPFEKAGPEVGLRDRAEIEGRLAVLREDAAQPPIGAGEVALLDDILHLREAAPAALGHLRDLQVDAPALAPAVDRFEARLAALQARGVDVETLDVEASYGRTSLEYYDGFVFGFYAEARPDLPPVATGGRYDALTRALGGGRGIPAVGGVIRPGLVLEVRR
ncbi:ATP phosphoribosyltransferase regulatory subunit [Roseitranquillus sediminis]|uniref:ATP phosphoribosyltransferase regulatory subunit n=1 Tax=Roseitranquillus sediminis TaxID=2809051 RepID=UPI001D0C8EC4|nr:ATP phosphoribosyltransferase regulatory subunit [Roseitranquillus sediminis]MBM9595924.1 ATP phosphoribosyltransferase regulatory subunit [Roseitranquillus sediminis]